MPPQPSFVFASFRLDPVSHKLWCDTQLLPLRPKTFAVLQYLVEHTGELVTRDDLLTTIWPDTTGADRLPKRSIHELRKVLGDDTTTPRFIETVSRRGWRFIAKVVRSQHSVVSSYEERRDWRLETSPSSPQASSLKPLASLLVGRDAELAHLHRLLDKALEGERQVVFVTGEPGIGKTSVTRAFLSQVAERGVAAIGRGQCVENYGPGEAYLPILEALGRLCRAPGGESLVEWFRQHAPTWLMQMPTLITASEVEQLQRQLQGATQTRMRQEMLAAVEALTPARPLVLLIEDLQWSDYSTLDLLATLARGQDPTWLMIIATYRPEEILGVANPLSTIVRELYAHQLANELPLRFLNEAAVTEYLQRRFPENGFPYNFAQLLQLRTEGSPLFLAHVLEDWVTRGILVQEEQGWTLQIPLEETVSEVPMTIRHLITLQSERLRADEQRILKVASLVGREFSAATIAAALQIEAMEVEEWCGGLTNRQQFLLPAGIGHWPDGTTSERYKFVHALHQQFWHERVRLGQRRQWHLRMGMQQEAAYGTHAADIAVELALHFEEGGDYVRAIAYRAQAAENARQRYAHQEAVSHLTKALELLAAQPDTPERLQQELALRTTLGISLQTIRGYGSAIVEQAYTRTRELCQDVREPAQLFRALFGLWQLHHVRAEFTASGALAEQLLSLATRTKDTDLSIEANGAMGVGSFQIGELTRARHYLEGAIALYEPQRHRSHTLTYGQDPWVASQSYLAETLWCQGYPDQALRLAILALAAAQELAHPFTQAFALTQILFIYKHHGNVPEVRNYTDTLQAVISAHEFPFWEPVIEMNSGWALSKQEQIPEGIERIRQSTRIRQRLGTALRQPYYNAVLAEIYGKVGQFAEGIQLLDEALEIANTSLERNWEAELYRLRGELLLTQRVDNQKSIIKSQKPEILGPQPLAPNTQAEVAQEAEESFLKAISIAQQQQAKSLELRAVMSLTRLWQQQGKTKQAHQMLFDVYNWFTEGFDTADLREAKRLLENLVSSV